MFTTLTSANRIVTQPLLTRFTREERVTTITNLTTLLPVHFYDYTRIRTKSWKYVGLDKASAVTGANALNLLFNRHVPKDWVYNQTLNQFQPYIITSSDPENEFHWQYIQAAVATVNDLGCGRYEVAIELNEELSYPFAGYLPWNAFEANPDVVTGRFASGVDANPDFDYDET